MARPLGKRAMLIAAPLLLVAGQLLLVAAVDAPVDASVDVAVEEQAAPCPGESMGVQATGQYRNQPIEEVVINGEPWGGANWAAGHRSYWHCHAGGQLMVLFEGEGRVQKRGERVETLHRGDSHLVERGEEHWHGGAPNENGHFLQASIQPGGVFWMEEVSDTDYLGNGIGMASRAAFLRTGVREQAR